MPSSVLIMACRWSDDKPLSGPMLALFTDADMHHFGTLVASLMSLMASLVTTSWMQQCCNVLIDICHEFLLLFYCCVLLEIKLSTTTQPQWVRCVLIDSLQTDLESPSLMMMCHHSVVVNCIWPFWVGNDVKLNQSINQLINQPVNQSIDQIRSYLILSDHWLLCVSTGVNVLTDQGSH